MAAVGYQFLHSTLSLPCFAPVRPARVRPVTRVVELRRATVFLARFDAIKRAVDDRFDVRGSVLATLIALCIEGNGVISSTKRKRYAEVVQPEALDCIEEATKAVPARSDAQQVQDSATTSVRSEPE